MYFYKKQGGRGLDLRGDLILTHNADLIRSKSRKSAPDWVRHARWIPLGRRGIWRRIVATVHAVRFIWSKPKPLTRDRIEKEGL